MYSTAPKAFVLVLMPVTPSFNDLFRYGVLDPCSRAGAYCERAGEHLHTEGYVDKLHHQIAKADLVVADLSGRTPDVFYELGYALALAKPVLLLAQQEKEIPADLRQLPHIVYAGSTTLAEEFEKRLLWLLDHPQQPLARAEPAVGLFVCGAELRDGMTAECHEEEGRFLVELGLHNRGPVASGDGAVRLSLEVPDEMPWGSPGMLHLRLPDTRWLYLLPPSGPIFPGAWDVKTVTLSDEVEPGSAQEVLLGVHTALGTARYRVTLKVPKPA